MQCSASWCQEKELSRFFNCNISISCRIYRANRNISEHTSCFKDACLPSFSCEIYTCCTFRLYERRSNWGKWKGLSRGDPTGGNGRAFREEIRKKIEKWQEPPPAKQPKPLPVPDSEPKKKRGGRRLRKMKQRYAITDMRKLANRMQFGVPEESSLGDGLGEGHGMLGQAGNGKLCVSVGQSKLAAKVAKKFKEKNYGSSGATSGLTSSLTFTPVQGIELSNPQALANQLGSGTQSTYFSETGTFSKIKRP